MTTTPTDRSGASDPWGWIAAGILAAGMVLVVFVARDVPGELHALRDLVLERRSGSMEQVKTTKWYSANAAGVCILQTVTTPKGTMDRHQWQAAHDEAVTDMQASYPPSPACPLPQ